VARRVHQRDVERGTGQLVERLGLLNSKETIMETNDLNVATDTNEETEQRLSIEVPTQIQAGLNAVCTCGPGGGCCGCCGVIIILVP
jgi:hypothetical protein